MATAAVIADEEEMENGGSIRFLDAKIRKSDIRSPESPGLLRMGPFRVSRVRSLTVAVL